MATSMTLGYGDRAGYETTTQAVRDAWSDPRPPNGEGAGSDVSPPTITPVLVADFDLASIDVFINTHLHFDHCGCVAG